jgi:hypothetical protein
MMISAAIPPETWCMLGVWSVIGFVVAGGEPDTSTGEAGVRVGRDDLAGVLPRW